jgi:hypothetical protein
MISILQRHPFVIALCVLAAILAAVIAAELGLGASLRAQVTGIPARRAAPFEAKLLPPQQVAQAEQLYPEVAARPLFTPTRRPAPVAAAPSTYTPGQFLLQGVIVVGDTRTAMLREKSSGRMHRVETGREINGIRISQIDREAVTLTQGSDREVLQLQVLRPGAVANAGPAPANAAVGPFGPMSPTGPAGFPLPGGPPAGVPAPPGQAPAIAGQPPGAPPPPSSPGMILNAPNPLTAPPSGTNPAAPAVSNAPMSPEELLARRRARRGQQSQ